MTKDQLDAREVICLLEGNLACHEDDRTLVCRTSEGREYRVDPDAKRIWRNDFDPEGYVTRSRMFDLVELETMLNDPMYAADYPVDPEEDALYEDVFARQDLPGPVTDFHEDRAIEMAEDRQRVIWDEAFYGRMEAC